MDYVDRCVLWTGCMQLPNRLLHQAVPASNTEGPALHGLRHVWPWTTLSQLLQSSACCIRQCQPAMRTAPVCVAQMFVDVNGWLNADWGLQPVAPNSSIGLQRERQCLRSPQGNGLHF